MGVYVVPGLGTGGVRRRLHTMRRVVSTSAGSVYARWGRCVSTRTYRDLVLLHTGVILCLHEALLTPPPYDVTIVPIVLALLVSPVALRRDEAKAPDSPA